jgi:Zn-dependent protease
LSSIQCPSCGLEIAPRLLACPACGWLVHGEALKELARVAEAAGEAGQALAAVKSWRSALELLPADSRQARVITEKIELLGRELEKGGDAPKAPGVSWAKVGGVLGAAALLLYKLKWLVVLALTKGKVLLLGLTKSSTLFTMLASAGIYWSLWGWPFAFGLVAAIYVHEMGHVVALQRLGIRATAPMFVPGLGAFVRLKQYPASPREDARVGLAGPIWGTGAVLVFFLAFLLTGWSSLGAIARFSAWLNLFNLLPIWQLDGGRGFRALGRAQRWGIAAVMGAMWLVTQEGLLLLLVIFAGIRAFGGEMPKESDRRAFWEFAVLVVVLALFSDIEVPGLAPPG